jgi:hypothetical protein
MKITYNSARPDLALPEYGRSIHNMVHHAMTIEDREERNRCVRSIIATMGNLFPIMRDTDDFKHKLWDHIYIMSDFKLDVDSPYPKPEAATFKSKPKQLKYPQSDIRFGHYGKIIEKIVNDVCLEEDEEKRKQLTIGLANLMKRTYLLWAENTPKDEAIANDLKLLSKGRLVLENPEEQLAPTNRIIQQMGISTHPQQQNQNRGKKGGRPPKKKVRRKHN